MHFFRALRTKHFTDTSQEVTVEFIKKKDFQSLLETSRRRAAQLQILGFVCEGKKFRDLQHPTIVARGFPVPSGDECPPRFQFLSLNGAGETILWSRCPVEGVGLL